MESGTDLVLLPHLELIPLESLPKKSGEELACLKKERKQLIRETIKHSFFALLCVFGAGWTGWIIVLAFLGFPSFTLFLGVMLLVIMLMIFSGAFALFFGKSICGVIDCCKMATPAQLKINAKAEKLLYDNAQRTNAQIADWNDAAATAAQYDLGGRYLRSLQKHRDVLSDRAAKIQKLAEHAGVSK